MRRSLSTTLGAVLTALLALLGAGTALAHSGLDAASPGPGETAKAGVERIEMNFAGALDASQPPRIEVKDPAGSDQVSGEVEVDGNRVTVHIEALKPGLHTVKYRTTFDDGHSTEGGYYLNVAPGPPGESDGGGYTFWLAVGGGAVIVVLLIVVIALIPRRSKAE
ncbi:copper resistance protein CopC [Saccharopolyspora rhizosphaerae]|uniref:Copper resistance protein CopC n=1 Tax=Saccharopolyspora rhizosphaerae TaxID=2492662 RepID=A0A3R8NTQ0_9PSEU|nr:copper resistance CopC family protein [Saccharopolyspora rhizosphaerae]RRO12897.1 copper resistance protein CopC [Saccharopolyspora rhizosphaerae]